MHLIIFANMNMYFNIIRFCYRVKLCADFLFLIVPSLCASTLLSSHLDGLYSTMAFVIGALLMFGGPTSANTALTDDNSRTIHTIKDIKMGGKQPFISWFRSYINVATAISILAVDFKIFPRRFAKAETFGTGVMDVGVGAYVISNAIVSPEARGKYIQAK